MFPCLFKIQHPSFVQNEDKREYDHHAVHNKRKKGIDRQGVVIMIGVKFFFPIAVLRSTAKNIVVATWVIRTIFHDSCKRDKFLIVVYPSKYQSL